MHYVPAPQQAVVAGRPLPFALRASDGRLLLERGAVIPSAAHVAALVQRGVWVAGDEADAFERAYRGQLEQMVLADTTLGRIAEVGPDLESMQRGGAGEKPTAQAWERLVGRLHLLLRGRPRDRFLEEIEQLRHDLITLLSHGPDRALLLLIHRAGHETDRYAAAHAVTVAVMCKLASKVLALPHPERVILTRVALTMNLSMSELQDRLATQERSPDEGQRQRIRTHAEASARELQELGVDDPIWLGAVARHHASPQGPLGGRDPVSRIARIVRQADIFAARLSRRGHRPACSPATAARSVFMDEDRQPDEAGAALIKALGLYPPGSLVRLVSGETGMVVRRGPAADKPVVAALIGKQGLPLGVPALRQTRQPAFAVQTGVAPCEFKLRADLNALMAAA